MHRRFGLAGERRNPVIRPAASLGALLLTVYAAAQPPALPRFDPQTIAANLETIWSLAFAPDGRLFLTERAGRIRIIDRDALAPEPWATIPVHESVKQNIETGLMGLAIDPQFSKNKRVYVCYTHSQDGTLHSNRIAVLTEDKGKGQRLTVLVGDIPAGPYHNGCRLKFGPDGKLYATTGDATGNRAEGGIAQSLGSLGGKILRLNPDGSVPADNPFPGSYIWSYGHRNSQGLAFQPRTGRLLATEHGTGEGGGNELNVIEKGKNYGWPVVIGQANDARFVDPILVRGDAPAGAAFVDGDRYPSLHGNLLIAAIGSERLLRVVFREGASFDVARTDVLIDTTFGRLRDVVQGPDGFVYIATSNRDLRRGAPAPDDDRVIRLRPQR
jgi:glucose/arabinose dehydrogenase